MSGDPTTTCLLDLDSSSSSSSSAQQTEDSLQFDHSEDPLPFDSELFSCGTGDTSAREHMEPDVSDSVSIIVKLMCTDNLQQSAFITWRSLYYSAHHIWSCSLGYVSAHHRRANGWILTEFGRSINPHILFPNTVDCLRPSIGAGTGNEKNVNFTVDAHSIATWRWRMRDLEELFYVRILRQLSVLYFSFFPIFKLRTRKRNHFVGRRSEAGNMT